MNAKSAVSPLAQAQQRAMPITRLLDCGMDYADALTLFARTSDGGVWSETAETLADLKLSDARKAESGAHLASARQCLRFAVANLVFAQMAFNQDTDEKRRLYDRLVDTLSRLAPLLNPAMERIKVPYRDGNLVGWLVRPPVPVEGTVVVSGGLSGWGGAYLPMASALAARGLATMLVEGPGQGEPRLKDKLFLDADVGSAYARFADVILEREDLGSAIGVWGNSFGGLFAAHAASRDPRFVACCINGAPAVPTVPDFRNAREQITASFGTDDFDEAVAVCDSLAFDPQQHRIPSALLVLHGGNDPLCSLSDQQPFVAAGSPALSTLRVWDDGEHTIYNHSAERTSYVADWFADVFAGRNSHS